MKGTFTTGLTRMNYSLKNFMRFFHYEQWYKLLESIL